ncbi:hypothetical protein SPWS13_0283 [Shewanella putrefaciens]|nr:hypothetical protein SPWS13_0283 [Shewanella putrefaciens]
MNGEYTFSIFNQLLYLGFILSPKCHHIVIPATFSFFSLMGFSFSLPHSDRK